MVLDVKKAYDSLYRMLCMQILQGNGIGKNLQRIPDYFWHGQTVVARLGRVLRLPV